MSAENAPHDEVYALPPELIRIGLIGVGPVVKLQLTGAARKLES